LPYSAANRNLLTDPASSVANAPGMRPVEGDEVAPEIPGEVGGTSVALDSSDPVLVPGRKRRYSDVRSVVEGSLGRDESGYSSSPLPIRRRLQRRFPEYVEASQQTRASVLLTDPGILPGARFSDGLDFEVDGEDPDPELGNSNPISDDIGLQIATSSREGSSLGGFIVPDSSPARLAET